MTTEISDVGRARRECREPVFQIRVLCDCPKVASSKREISVGPMLEIWFLLKSA